MGNADMDALHERALRQAGEVVAGVRPEQMHDPTPCAHWDVRTVINHMIGGNYMYAEIAAGRSVDMSPPHPDLVGEDAAASYESSRRAVADSVAAEGALQRMWALPFAEVPGPVGRNIHLLELVAHTWDIAHATGQLDRLDPELADAAHGVATMAVPNARSTQGHPFGPEREAPDDAGPYERVAAFLGRTP
jgi:uncharacterized protein (TIGR03086 family)